jgi:hypothetical protein
MDKLFELDPNGSVLGFADMMRKQIVMPAHLMDDGQHLGKTGRNLFAVSDTWVLLGVGRITSSTWHTVTFGIEYCNRWVPWNMRWSTCRPR